MDLPRLKDICTGMGGLSYGYVQAGYEVDKGIDTWDVALKTYNKYIGKGVHQDLADYYPTRGDYDVIIVGGTPCQDFSLVNTRRNIYSKRAQLVLDFCRVVKAMQPVAFMFENVTHLSKWATAALLEMPGYKVTMNRVNTSHYGVPQARHRKIFIGCKGKHLVLRPPAGLTRPTVRDTFNKILKNWGFTKHRPETVDRFTRMHSTKWTSKEGLSNYQGIIRLVWDEPSCGIVNVKKAQILHPGKDRVITLAEALALQGFPSWYVPEGTDTEKAVQIANAVPPRLAYHIANQLKRRLLH